MIKIQSTRVFASAVIVISFAGAALFAQAPMPKSSPDRLKQDVEYLAAIQPPRNFEHPASLDVAAAYIRMHLEQFGYEVTEQPYTVANNVYKNLIVHLGPKEGERIVVGAHYDVCDDLPGADDNGSGTAGLLEIARLMFPLRDQLKTPVELVFYTLEEPPNFGEKTMGSYVHAESLANENVKVRLMMSLEMIGYFGDTEGTQEYPLSILSWFYPTKGNFIGIVGRTKEFFMARNLGKQFGMGSSLPVQTIGAPRFIEGVDWSDHGNYWDFGYPAVMITDTAFARNHNYHKATDLPETLDFARMSEVVNGVIGIILKNQGAVTTSSSR